MSVLLILLFFRSLLLVGNFFGQYVSIRKTDKLIREQMDKLHRDNQQFLTNISNEFRKPLTVIIAILNNIVADAAVVAGKNRIGKVLKQVVYLQGLFTLFQSFIIEEQEDVAFSF